MVNGRKETFRNAAENSLDKTQLLPNHQCIQIDKRAVGFLN